MQKQHEDHVIIECSLSVFNVGCCLISYDVSDDGWDDELKQKEMSDQASRYMLLFRKESPTLPVGFVHYQILSEMDEYCLYWYQIS
jgi:hypothetical protein